MSKVSPVGRVSYPHVFEANEFQGKRNFSITLIFDSADELKDMKALANEVAKAKWPKGLPSNFRSPFRDGDEKNQPEYEGKTYITFKCNEDRPPQVVGPDKQPIVKGSGKFYPGCFARVSFSCYAYDTAGNRGVSFGLNNVQKVRDGDRLDSGSTADSDFDALEEVGADLF